MTDSVTIRPLTAADIPEIAAWVAATPLWQRYRVTEESMRARLHQGLDQNAAIVVAERLGRVLGFLWFVPRGGFDRGDYVQLIGVRPDERSHGVGRALMAFAEGESRDRGRDVFLLVSDFNARAQQFYQRLGYREVGLLEAYVIPGVNELIYVKYVSKR